VGVLLVGVGKLGNGKREENWRESAANKQNVNGEADESDNIVASDFQLFFIFLRSNKRHSKTGAATQRGISASLADAKVDYVAASTIFFFSPHILLVFAFLALLGQAKGRA